MFSNGVELATAYPHIVDRPKSIYGYQTHNLYKDYPPMMADGRVISASWQPEAVINNNLVKMVGVTSNWHSSRLLCSSPSGLYDTSIILSATSCVLYGSVIFSQISSVPV